MKKDKNYWEPVFNEFSDKYPELTDHIVDWYPSAQMEITVKLDDGRKYAYDWLPKVATLIYDPKEESDDIDEEEWRLVFSNNLYRKLRNFGMTQDVLSELTGISQVTISKYLNGRATPSMYNVRKIARALRCTISELTY